MEDDDNEEDDPDEPEDEEEEGTKVDVFVVTGDPYKPIETEALFVSLDDPRMLMRKEAVPFDFFLSEGLPDDEEEEEDKDVFDLGIFIFGLSLASSLLLLLLLPSLSSRKLRSSSSSLRSSRKSSVASSDPTLKVDP